MPKSLSILFFCVVSSLSFAQPSRILEPSTLEVRYKTTFGTYKDIYILRCGKTMSQYFSYYKLRNDSLSSSPEGFMIIQRENLDWAQHPNNPQRQLSLSPGHGEYLYRNLPNEKLSIYTSVRGSGYRIVEDIPVMDWTIIEDSVMMIMDYRCHLAKTQFRGREWEVWFTYDIPLSQGPWKLGGLPGLILRAESPGFVSIDAYFISGSNLTPITFYNFWGKKFTDIERLKYIKIRTDPKSYPKNTAITPQMEKD